MPPPFRMNETILIRGLNWLGDAVMSTPALSRLRAAQPHARLVLLTTEKLRELWLGHPAIDEVITFGEGESVFRVGRRLRSLNAGTALVLPNSPRSALEVWLAGIPRRVGYARPWRSWMLTERVAPRATEVAMTKRSAYEVRLLIETGIEITRPPLPEGSHHIYQYLELAGLLGASTHPCPPELVPAAAAVTAVSEKFGASPKPARTRPLIGINAGAEFGPAKRWPPERFVDAAAAFHRQRASDWWVLGGPGDRELAERITADLRVRLDASADVTCLAGRTSLGELCAVLQTCDVLLTNDTGPMHVAAAVGTPVVAVFGSTSPELTGPGLPGDPRHQLLREAPPCAPCFLPECPIDFRCMNALSAERVVQALAKAVGS